MHFANGEVVELKTQSRRDVRVRRLLKRQRDVQRHRLSIGIVGSPVSGFHDARTATGLDDELALVTVGEIVFGDDLGELATLFIVSRF